jgi:hypothetical protein
MCRIIFDADFSKFLDREDVVEMQKRQKSSNKTKQAQLVIARHKALTLISNMTLFLSLWISELNNKMLFDPERSFTKGTKFS